MTRHLDLTSRAPGVRVDAGEPASRHFPPGWWVVPVALAGVVLWVPIACVAIVAVLN